MKRPVLVVLWLAVLAVGLTAPLSLAPHELAANEGDPLHISWILAWDAHQLVRDPLDLFDANAFHPYAESLSFSEHMIVEGLIAAPLNLLTGNALLAQNVTVLLMVVLSGAAMFFFVREVLGRDDAALVAAVLFAFNSHQLSHLPRLQLLSFAFWPLAALFLHRYLRRGGGASALLFALFLLLQNLSCTYYLVYVSLVLLWWIPASFLVFRRKPEGRDVAWLGLSLAGAAAITTLFAVPYLRRYLLYGFERELAMGLDLLEYVTPEPRHALWGGFPFAGRPDEISYFLGFGTMLLAAVGLGRALFGEKERRRREMLLLIAFTALAGLVLSLGPVMIAGDRGFGQGPYWWLYDTVPLLRGLRSPERFAVLVFFGAAVLAGYGASRLVAAAREKWRAPALAALALALPLEHYMGPPSAVPIPAGDETPAVYRYLAELEGDGAVVELPLYPRVQLRFYSLYMFYSTVHWKPIVFGRTSFYPPVTELLAWELRQSFPDETSLALLSAIGVETLVVHPLLWEEAERAEKLARLDALPDLEGLASFPESDDPAARRLGLGGERVYRLRPMAVDPEPLCVPSGEISQAGWSAEGSGNDDPAKAIDGDPGTKWRKRAPEREDYLSIDMGREETVSALRIPLSYPFDEFPRHLVLRGRDEAGPGRRIDYRDDLAAKLELVRALVEEPSRASLTLRFPPARLRFLRFVLRDPELDLTLPDWAVSEVKAYRECVAPAFTR